MLASACSGRQKIARVLVRLFGGRGDQALAIECMHRASKDSHDRAKAAVDGICLMIECFMLANACSGRWQGHLEGEVPGRQGIFNAPGHA